MSPWFGYVCSDGTRSGRSLHATHHDESVEEGRLVVEQADDISDLPVEMVDRLEHYFLTYKMTPGMTNPCR